MLLVNVLTPDVPNVSLICVASPTVNVPIILVLPLSVSTSNFATAEPFCTEKTSFASSITRESLTLICP